MIVWINGTHGVGKTTTATLVQQRIPDSRVLDAEKAARTWLHEEAEVVDTTHTTPGQAAEQIAGAVTT